MSFIFLVGIAFALFCVIFSFVVTGKGGKIFLGSLVIALALVALTFPRIRLYLNLGAVFLGLCCFVYLIGKGYMYNLRVFRGKASHDKF